MRGFGSDNHSGVHPEILRAVEAANVGHAHSYGDDPWTERAVAAIRRHFGRASEVFFVFTGTAANVLGIKALTQPYHAVICAETAHLNVDECGAPEKFLGCKLLTVGTRDGKLTPNLISKQLQGIGDQHRVQPKVVSISQSTEYGTVYTPKEVRALADFGHARGLYLHVDGARLANAAASLNVPLRQLTDGVDVLSLGGTKNGMMAGEAVVFFAPRLAGAFRFIRKQGMHLASKMRFLAAQFEALLSGDLWLRNARHSNAMARLLASKVRRLVQVTQPVQANAVFAMLPKRASRALQRDHFFYVWNEETGEVRWMTSFDTTTDDIDSFVKSLRKVLR